QGRHSPESGERSGTARLSWKNRAWRRPTGMDQRASSSAGRESAPRAGAELNPNRWRVLRVDWRARLVNQEPLLARVNLTKGDLLLCRRRLQPSLGRKHTSPVQERFIPQRLLPPAARLRVSHQHPSSGAPRGLKTCKSKFCIAAFATRIFIRSAMSGKL